MKLKLLSLDLQGTISDSAFSSYFWLETLPSLYSRSRGLSESAARLELRERFGRYGRSDYRYYDHDFWLAECGSRESIGEILNSSPIRPALNNEWLSLIQRLAGRIPVVILSSTTRQFIRFELGQHAPLFSAVFSTLDDFWMPGKPASAFQEMAARTGHKESTILHVGDDQEHDCKNAREAGLISLHWTGSQADIRLVEEMLT